MEISVCPNFSELNHYKLGDIVYCDYENNKEVNQEMLENFETLLNIYKLEKNYIDNTCNAMIGVKSIITTEYDTLNIYLCEKFWIVKNYIYGFKQDFDSINDLYNYLDALHPNLRKEVLFTNKPVNGNY